MSIDTSNHPYLNYAFEGNVIDNRDDEINLKSQLSNKERGRDSKRSSMFLESPS